MNPTHSFILYDETTELNNRSQQIIELKQQIEQLQSSLEYTKQLVDQQTLDKLEYNIQNIKHQIYSSEDDLHDAYISSGLFTFISLGGMTGFTFGLFVPGLGVFTPTLIGSILGSSWWFKQK